MMNLVLALALAGVLVAGCSESSSPLTVDNTMPSGKSSVDGAIQGSGIYIAAGDVNGVTEALKAIEEAMLDYSGPTPEPVALLVPAVQKVREAAAGAHVKVFDGRSMVSADKLLKSFEQAERHFKKATLTMRKGGGENSAEEATDFLLAFFTACETYLADNGIDDRAILAALAAADAPAETMSLNFEEIK